MKQVKNGMKAPNLLKICGGIITTQTHSEMPLIWVPHEREKDVMSAAIKYG